MTATATHATTAAARRRSDTGRIVVWGGYALVLVVAPLVFTSNLDRSILTSIGVAIVACLSYNMLLGQGGMLSFGHAVYTGLGTFVAMHALLGIGDGSFPLTVSLIPLVGGVAGMGFAVVLGCVPTKKAGPPFARITLGIGGRGRAMARMSPEFCGGEGGVSANRVVGLPVVGIS